jgi:hypothetical protein
MYKKIIFLTVLTFQISGCFLLGEPAFYPHDVIVSLKSGVPCFAIVDDEFARRAEVNISSVSVWPHQDITNLNVKWESRWEKDLKYYVLQSDECILYGGAGLEKNVMYSVGFSVFVDHWPHATHSYSAAFCLSEDKKGETILHQFSDKNLPFGCPASE